VGARRGRHVAGARVSKAAARAASARRAHDLGSCGRRGGGRGPRRRGPVGRRVVACTEAGDARRLMLQSARWGRNRPVNAHLTAVFSKILNWVIFSPNMKLVV
jgi:hypothetical protein